MRRHLCVLVGVLGAGLMTAASVAEAPMSLASESASYSYVAASVGTVGPGTGATQTPAGPVAPFGHFEVTPRSTSFTFTLDDFGTVDGMQIPVHLNQNSKRLLLGCLPVRSETTISGAIPGRPVWVFVFGPDFATYCSAFGTAGVATFEGVT